MTGAAVDEVERDGVKTGHNNQPPGVGRLVGFPPLCRPLQKCLHFANKNVRLKKTQQQKCLRR